MNILKKLNRDRLYFSLFFLSLTFVSYLSIYFSLVYEKPDYLSEITPYAYIPFFFIWISIFFLIPQIFFGYLLNKKKPLFVFLSGVFSYILIFGICEIYVDNFWIQFHQISVFSIFNLIN